MTLEYKKWQDVVKKKKKKKKEEGTGKSLLPLPLLLPPVGDRFSLFRKYFIEKTIRIVLQKVLLQWMGFASIASGTCHFSGFKAPPTYHKFRAKVSTNRDFN